MLDACAWWREFLLICNLNTSISVLLNSSYTIFATSSKQMRCEGANETQSIALTVTALLRSWLASWGFRISFWRRGALFYDPTGWILSLLYPAPRLITCSYGTIIFSFFRVCTGTCQSVSLSHFTCKPREIRLKIIWWSLIFHFVYKEFVI
jgi:hypothetical protein